MTFENGKRKLGNFGWGRFARVGAGALLLGSAGCSSEVPPDGGAATAKTFAALGLEDGLSFENASDWEVFAGAATLVDAGSALRLSNVNGYVEVRNVTGVGSFEAAPTTRVTVDIPDLDWGWASLYFDVPSQGIYRQYAGPVDLTNLAAGRHVLELAIPAHVLTALGGTYTDFRIGIAFAVPVGTTLDLVDLALDEDLPVDPCVEDPSQNSCQAWTGRYMLGLRNVGWQSFRNQTREEIASHVAGLAPNGFLPINLGSAHNAGSDYSIVVRENVDGRDWKAHWDLTGDEYHALWETYSGQNLRPLDVEAYYVDGQQRFAGIWIENREGIGWFSYRNFTPEEYAEHFEEYRDLGYWPVDIEVYDTSAGQRISTVWYDNVDGVGWKQLRNMTREEYQAETDALGAEGYFAIDYEEYGDRIAAIWQKPAHTPAVVVRTGRQDVEFANLWRQHRDEGYRPLQVADHGDRYAGIWIVNDDRFDYDRKGTLDTAIEDYRVEHEIEGISVALIRGGRVIYQRGFGHADVDGNKVAHGETVYAAASVSKVFGGTLATLLETSGQLRDGTPVELDMTERTDTYLPDIPEHHTHTVEQLTSHQGCVLHYNTIPSGPNPTSHFTSALSAAQTFWDEGLVTERANEEEGCTIGTNVSYSTHAFTLLDAVLEEVTGRRVSDLIRTELTEPLGLGSVHTAWATGSLPDNRERAVPYHRGSAISYENTSWKVSGGGLEMHAVDLARFGSALLRGDVLADADRDNRLWARVGSGPYGVAWQTTTIGGRDVVQHGGLTDGANTYIRVYRDDDLVVAIMSNTRGIDSADPDRRDPHPIWDLATTIGDAVLAP